MADCDLSLPTLYIPRYIAISTSHVACIYDYKNYARQLESIETTEISIIVHLARAIVHAKKFIRDREVTKTKFSVTISRSIGNNILERNGSLQSYFLAILHREVFTERIDFTVGRWITGRKQKQPRRRPGSTAGIFANYSCRFSISARMFEF